MLILTLRTDKPQAELGLFDGEKQLAYSAWPAHRQLAETIHQKIKQSLEEHAKAWPDIEGIVVFKGPGSFTGLRIGSSVANALADSLAVPIAGETGEGWALQGIQRLLAGQNDRIVLPAYGAPPHITPPKH
ncbi:MAG TPA: tRNA (adenosine(37)-N6)-threonylcarbamoyltransferase complex dimerization subunit type 1 TsaB [Candidatus Saccharimonadales bacterium]|nr:tRNA (adenosine(37)-N6)-threonylcarbamoyltransferase complex dimerization subunit type 1 TsaB [Candidatus Saccharimonadales bacterium]